MKIKVKKVQFMQLQCVDSSYSLVNKIYKSYFGHDIFDGNIKLQFDKVADCLVQYRDNSYHGSPLWQKQKEIKDKELIELNKQLKKTYYMLLNVERATNNR